LEYCESLIEPEKEACSDDPEQREDGVRARDSAANSETGNGPQENTDDGDKQNRDHRTLTPPHLLIRAGVKLSRQEIGHIMLACVLWRQLAEGKPLRESSKKERE